MTMLNESASNHIIFFQSAIAETEEMLDAYGSLEAANIYFDNRLRNRPWKRADNDEKNAALREATELIDRLFFTGSKTDETQDHEFPRNGDVQVPWNVQKACYEIALKLADGFDPEIEVANLAAVSQGYSSVRTTYERTFVLEHLRAGIPSSKAWELLKPFLADPNALKLSREN